MGSAADLQTGGDGRDAGMLNLTAVPLAGLLALAGSDVPLAHALRRLLSEDDVEMLSAFDSIIRLQ